MQVSDQKTGAVAVAIFGKLCYNIPLSARLIQARVMCVAYITCRFDSYTNFKCCLVH